MRIDDLRKIAQEDFNRWAHEHHDKLAASFFEAREHMLRIAIYGVVTKMQPATRPYIVIIDDPEAPHRREFVPVPPITSTSPTALLAGDDLL